MNSEGVWDFGNRLENVKTRIMTATFSVDDDLDLGVIIWHFADSMAHRIIWNATRGLSIHRVVRVIENRYVGKSTKYDIYTQTLYRLGEFLRTEKRIPRKVKKIIKEAINFFENSTL